MKAIKYFLFFLTAMVLPAWVELIWGGLGKEKVDDTTTL